MVSKIKILNYGSFRTKLWGKKYPINFSYKKSAGNLELRIVNKAGHLVPMDQPEAALDLVKSFVEAHKK